MRSYRRLAQSFLSSATVAGATPDEEPRGARQPALLHIL